MSLVKLVLLSLAASTANAASKSSSSSSSSSASKTQASAQPSVFHVTNFSASAQFKSDAEYRADIEYTPNFSAHCATHAGGYKQCEDAAGITKFNKTECNGPNNTLPDGRWYWQLNPADKSGVQPSDGFNFEFTFLVDGVDGGRTLYGCKYFPESAVKCNNTVFTPNGPPATYLDVPSNFTVPIQTTSGCKYDDFTTTVYSAPPTSTPKTTVTTTTTTKKATTTTTTSKAHAVA